MKVAGLFIIGMALLVQGILFALQGAGIVHWPASSFMVNDRDWIERGIAMGLIGIAFIAGAWRVSKLP